MMDVAVTPTRVIEDVGLDRNIKLLKYEGIAGV